MPELTLIAEFEKALANYQLSEHAKEILHRTKLVLLTAPTASGRNTIINELIRTNEYNFIVSDTTRPPRYNNGILEQNGREYFFRSEEDMLKDIREGNFLEAEIIHKQQVSGISIRELEKASSENRAAITDVDIGGVSNILALKFDAVAILVLPPNFAVWQERIFGRGTMGKVEHRRRLETAAHILRTAVEGDRALKIIINDVLSDAAQAIHELVQKGIYTPAQQEQGIAVAAELLRDTEAAIAKL